VEIKARTGAEVQKIPLTEAVAWLRERIVAERAGITGSGGIA